MTCCLNLWRLNGFKVKEQLKELPCNYSALGSYKLQDRLKMLKLEGRYDIFASVFLFCPCAMF